MAESIEVRDLAAKDEALGAVPTPEASDRPRLDPDPAVLFEDPFLHGLVARSLGLATTASFDDAPEVHEPILASDLASLGRLDAAGLGITSLVGLELATNLRSLSLGRNSIEDFSPLVPRRAESGNVVGLRNLESLRGMGFLIVQPREEERKAKLASAETIVAHCARALAPEGALNGRKVVVLAGSTEEPIDSVRLLSNRSSGALGRSLAEEAFARGADVSVLLGRHDVPPPPYVEVRRFTTVSSLLEATSGIPGCLTPTACITPV